MKNKIFLPLLIFMTLSLAACSNLVNELLDSFNSQNVIAATKADYGLDSVTAAESADPGIARVTVNDDGSVTFTSHAPGTTTVTVTGSDTNPENGRTQIVTIIYEVTVAEDGVLTYKEKEKKLVELFPEKTESLTPIQDVTEFSTTSAAISANEAIVTASVNADGTVTLTSKGEGSTTVSVKGRDTNGDVITLTYTVTVDENGEITTGAPVVFTNKSDTIIPPNIMVTTTETTSSPAGIVTSEVNSDGTVKVISQAAGTTTVTVKGKDSNNDVVTMIYEVTVDADGSISNISGGSPFTNQTAVISPLTVTNGPSNIISAASGNTAVATLSANSDGTYTVTAQGTGSTTITVSGKNDSDEDVDVTYNVTVAANGSLTVGTASAVTVCTLSFNSNGGSGTIPSVRVQKNASHTINADSSLFSMDDHRVSKWNTAADGSGDEYALNGSITVDSNITLYAVWAELYDIVIADGITDGTVTADKSEAIEGETVTLTITPDEGHGLGALYKNGVEVTPTPVQTYSFTMPEEDVTVSATFVNGYTVTFHANGGIGTMVSQLIVPNTPTALNSNTFVSPTDCKFLGWSTSPTNTSATTATYANCGNITITENTDLYAVWQLKFRANKNSVVAGDIALKHTNGSIRYAPQSAWPDSSYADYNGYTTVVGVCVNTSYMMGLEQNTYLSYNDAVTWAGNYGTTHSGGPWSLPSKDLLITIRSAKTSLNSALSKSDVGGTTLMNDIWYFSTTQYNENLMWQVKINGGEGTISKTHEQDDFAALVVWSLP